MELSKLVARAEELESQYTTLVAALETRLENWSAKKWEEQVRYDTGAQHNSDRQLLEAKLARIAQERDEVYREIHAKQLELAALDMNAKHAEQVSVGKRQVRWGIAATVVAAAGLVLTLVTLALTVWWHGK